MQPIPNITKGKKVALWYLKVDYMACSVMVHWCMMGEVFRKNLAYALALHTPGEVDLGVYRIRVGIKRYYSIISIRGREKGKRGKRRNPCTI